MFHILVVDDDKNTRIYFEAVLKSNGYTVCVANNGVEALNAMDKEHIDLVVLDVMMPQMDGYEFTKTLRECDNNLPILMVSAKQMPMSPWFLARISPIGPSRSPCPKIYS